MRVDHELPSIGHPLYDKNKRSTNIIMQEKQLLEIHEIHGHGGSTCYNN